MGGASNRRRVRKSGNARVGVRPCVNATSLARSALQLFAGQGAGQNVTKPVALQYDKSFVCRMIFLFTSLLFTKTVLSCVATDCHTCLTSGCQWCSPLGLGLLPFCGSCSLLAGAAPCPATAAPTPLSTTPLPTPLPTPAPTVCSDSLVCSHDLAVCFAHSHQLHRRVYRIWRAINVSTPTVALVSGVSGQLLRVPACVSTQTRPARCQTLASLCQEWQVQRRLL